MGQTTNLGSVAIGEETSVKTPGTTAVKQPLRSEDFLNPLTFDPSGEFRDDRLTTRYDLIAEDAQGGIDVNFRYGVHDDILEGAFTSTWGQGVVRDNNEVAADITDIAIGAVTVANGTAFVAGSMILMTGNNDAANNGVFEVDAAPSATSVPIVGSPLTVDAAPAATSRIVTVGVKGAAGDIVAVSDGLTTTTLDFTTFAQLKKDAWIKIGGTGVGFRFTGQPQNNTWAKIALVESNKLTLTNLPSTWAADTGAGKTIKIWFSDLISIGDGTLKQSYFIQKRIPISGGARYLKLLGCYPSLFRIDTTARGRIVGRIEMQGCGGEFDATPIVASPSEIGRHPFLANTPRRPFASGRSIARLQEGSGPYASGSFCVPNISFTLLNQLIPVECVDTLGYDDMEFGEAETSQNGNINLQTASVYEKFRGETESAISCIMVQDQQAYVSRLSSRYFYNR